MDIVSKVDGVDALGDFLLCPPVDFFEFEIERFHAFDGFFDGNLFGHSTRILGGDLCAIGVSNTSATMVEWSPEHVAVCFALDSTGKWVRN